MTKLQAPRPVPSTPSPHSPDSTASSTASTASVSRKVMTSLGETLCCTCTVRNPIAVPEDVMRAAAGAADAGRAVADALDVAVYQCCVKGGSGGAEAVTGRLPFKLVVSEDDKTADVVVPVPELDLSRTHDGAPFELLVQWRNGDVVRQVSSDRMHVTAMERADTTDSVLSAH